MGARGPAPTPTKTLEARGSWRAKTRKNEPGYTSGIPDCPEWIPPVGKEEWARIVVIVEAVPGVLQQVNWPSLALYCEAWAEYVAVVKACRSKSVSEVMATGLSAQKMKLRNDVSRLAQQFGFTPASRTRVQAGTNASDQTAKGESLESKYFGKPRIAATG